MNEQKATCRVRPARLDDANEMQRLEAAAFGDASWGGNAVAEGLTASLVYGLVAEAGKEARLADFSLSGFALWRDLSDEAEILTIGVHPDVRRRGVASALLEAIITAACDTDARKLFLEVARSNIAAAALYEKRGFLQVGERKGYYRNGDDAIVMRLALADQR